MVERVEAALHAIEETQPRLNAFTSVLTHEALGAARELDRREPDGPLHGLPVVVKDLFDVAGAPTTGGCGAYQARAPAAGDSDVVAALRAAGAVVVAKTNQHELGGGAECASAFRLTVPGNEAGLPAVAFPVGLSSDNLPLGAQLIGRPYDDETLPAVVEAFQKATDHHLHRP